MLRVVDAQGRLKTKDETGAVLPDPVQGDLPYGSAVSVFSLLPKNTNASRYLSNQGTSNNPAWNQVNLANGVTGTLPESNGGTGTGTVVTKVTAPGAKAFLGWTYLTAVGGIASSGAAPTLVQTGWTAGNSIGGGATSNTLLDTGGYWWRVITSATGGESIAHTHPSSGGWTYTDHNPTGKWRFRLGSDITNVRIWVALVNSNFTNADDQSARKGFGVVYSTVRGDTGWMTWKSDGTTQTVGSQVAAIAASTIYSITVSLSGGDGGTVTIDINGTTATFTAPSIASISLHSEIRLITTTASTKELDFEAVYGERS